MGGQHRVCEGGRARAAAIYPFILCKAMLQGMRSQLRADDKLHDGVHGIQHGGNAIEVQLLEQLAVMEADLSINALGYNHATFKDGLTGQPLIPEMVMEARRV